MELTPLQLEIMQLGADKSLSPGYIYENLGYRQEVLIEHETEDDILYDVRDTQTNEIVRINRNTILLATNHNIGHPITYSRLCYLAHEIKRFDKFADLTVVFANNPKLYIQDVLTRDDKTLNLVRDFLLSIQ